MNQEGEIVFDEAERKKFDALAQQFLTDDVSDLPKRLEATINDYHNKNATLLANNASKLQTAAYDLEGVLGSLTDAVAASADVRKKEAEVYRSLQSIDSNRDKDAAVVNHQKEVKDKLQEIYDVAKIPDDVRSNLMKPALSDVQYLDTLYEMLEQATKDRYAKEPPAILKGLALAERRVEELDRLLTMFKNEFTRFMQTKLGRVKACIAWVEFQENMIKSAENDPSGKTKLKKIPGIDKESLVYVPSLKPNEKLKKFSENLESHKVFRSIFPYWKFFYWMREYFPDCYHDIVYSYYMACAKQYAEHELLQPVYELWVMVQQYTKGKNPSSEPFHVDEDLSSASATEISAKLKTTLGRVFSAIKMEACIVTEFWQIDELMLVQQMMSEKFWESLTRLIDAITMFDPFFAMKSYGMSFAAGQVSKVPMNMIIDIPRKIWEEYMKKQKELLIELKVTKTKTSVLSPFRDFIQFASKYSQTAEDAERPVLNDSLAEMCDYLVDWLITRVAPKFSKKKRTRLIVLNLSHLCDKMRSEQYVQKSEVLMANLKKHEILLDQNIRVLLKFIVSKNWVHASRFFDQISDWKEVSGLTDEMVTFQPSHTQDKFVELNDRIDKRLATCVNECYAYMKKKLRHEGMRQVLRVSIVPFVKEQFALWNDMAMQCYDLKLSVTPEKVGQLMADHA